MRFEQIVSEGLIYSAIYNLSLVCYEVALILIERLIDSVIYNFKITYGDSLDES